VGFVLVCLASHRKQKFGLPGSEVYSPDFLNQHRPGDRWFCTICFGPMICKLSWLFIHVASLQQPLSEMTVSVQSEHSCALVV
jgi:hypothetical protein